MGEWFWWAMSYVVLPSDTAKLTIYYLFWMSLFIAINTIWDIWTPKTPKFHIAVMKDKQTVLYDAATFCSSLLIITAIASPTVRQISKDTTLPLLIAGASGLLRTIPALCPYKITLPSANNLSNSG